MKLILKEYLSSIRERDELDVILPDLLSQMGLDVFSAPSVGGRQYGVDVAAVGSIDGKEETVYLFSVKSKDLTRQVWNSGNIQDLQPSLDDILTTYIPTHLPTEHEGKPIEVCLCYGGELKENVRLNVTQYEKKNETDNISFSHWHGEKLSGLIEKNFLREDLLPKEFRGLLRKSLALLDEPESSYQFFKKLINLILVDYEKPENELKALRQVNICLWVLYSWCRDQGNVESAYLSSELAVLQAWEYVKKYRSDKKKLSISILTSMSSIHQLYQKIAEEFVEEKILDKSSGLHVLSSGINSLNPIDVNLKIFDLLGRISLSGLWSFWHINILASNPETKALSQNLFSKLQVYRRKLISVIANNPILFTPYKDDQAIDIVITSWFLSITNKNNNDLNNWLINIVSNTSGLFSGGGTYPCTLSSYYELLNHPLPDDQSYLERVTAGSTLYPLISMIAAIHGFSDVYKDVQDIKNNFLRHSNFQVWYASKSTEDGLYNNSVNHGLTLSDVPVDQSEKEYLKVIFRECEDSNSFDELSAINCWPIILTACRHHRNPVPIDFFYGLYKKMSDETKLEVSSS
jgi:hypothetical protein